MTTNPIQLDLALDESLPTLQDLRYHVRRLDDKLGTHIQSCREFVDMCKEEAVAHTKWQELYERNAETNMEAIAALTASIADLTKATSGLVEAWSAIIAVQRFVKWISAFAFVGGLVIWFVSNTKFIIKSLP